MNLKADSSSTWYIKKFARDTNDIKYAEQYPNSYVDIWYPDDSGEKRPVFVYFHGGGFLCTIVM